MASITWQVRVHMSYMSMPVGSPHPMDHPCGPTFTPTPYNDDIKCSISLHHIGLLIICFHFFYILGKQVNKNDTCYQGVA